MYNIYRCVSYRYHGNMLLRLGIEIIFNINNNVSNSISLPPITYRYKMAAILDTNDIIAPVVVVT